MQAHPDAPDDWLEPEDRAALTAEAMAAGAARADGWTAERRIAFLEALAAGHKVTAAARHVGMTPQGARKLRRRAPEFARVWDETFAFLAAELEESALHRAIHGSERPMMSRGRQVGTRIHYHDRLALQLLAVRDPMTYAPLHQRAAWLKATACVPGDQALSQNMAFPETSETSETSADSPRR
jgi:hypothetical protein